MRNQTDFRPSAVFPSKASMLPAAGCGFVELLLHRRWGGGAAHSGSEFVDFGIKRNYMI
jgi:hypothetical protein